MPNRRGAARPGPDPVADRYVVANIATLAALDNTPGSEQDRWLVTDAGHAGVAAWDARQDGPGTR